MFVACFIGFRLKTKLWDQWVIQCHTSQCFSTDSLLHCWVDRVQRKTRMNHFLSEVILTRAFLHTRCIRNQLWHPAPFRIWINRLMQQIFKHRYLAYLWIASLNIQVIFLHVLMTQWCLCCHCDITIKN